MWRTGGWLFRRARSNAWLQGRGSQSPTRGVPPGPTEKRPPPWGRGAVGDGEDSVDQSLFIPAPVCVLLPYEVIDRRKLQQAGAIDRRRIPRARQGLLHGDGVERQV